MDLWHFHVEALVVKIDEDNYEEVHGTLSAVCSKDLKLLKGYNLAYEALSKGH